MEEPLDPITEIFVRSWKKLSSTITFTKKGNEIIKKNNLDPIHEKYKILVKWFEKIIVLFSLENTQKTMFLTENLSFFQDSIFHIPEITIINETAHQKKNMFKEFLYSEKTSTMNLETEITYNSVIINKILHDISCLKYKHLTIDLLGMIYEYFLNEINQTSVSKDSQKKKHGQFYTPHLLVQKMVKESVESYLKTYKGDLRQIYNNLYGVRASTTGSVNIQQNQIYNIDKTGVIISRGGGSFTQNEIYNCGQSGVIVSNENGGTYSSNDISNCKGTGFMIHSGDGTLIFNTVTDCDTGIHAHDLEQVNLQDNTVEDNEKIGIKVTNTPQVSLTNNEANDNGGAGIHLGHIYDGNGAISPGSTNIANNDAERNAIGLNLYAVYGGSIFNNNIKENRVFGMNIEGSTSLSVTQNEIDYNLGVGLRELNSDSNVYDDNNLIRWNKYGVVINGSHSSVFTNNFIGFSTKSGFRLGGSEMLIENNDIKENEEHGLYITGSNHTISFNEIEENYNGIYIVGDHNEIGSDNQIIDNSFGGIHIEGSQNYVHDNNIWENSEYGIIVLGSDNHYKDI